MHNPLEQGYIAHMLKSWLQQYNSKVVITFSNGKGSFPFTWIFSFLYRRQDICRTWIWVTRTAYPSREHGFTPVFSGVRVAHLYSFLCCVFSRVRVAYIYSFLCCVFSEVRVAHFYSFLCCVFSGVRVAHLYSFLCCFCFVCLFFSTLWEKLPVFPDCPVLLIIFLTSNTIFI
jgi:hypothetical protein